MLEAAAPYARWIDVFCEPHSPHAFDADEARQILKAGARPGSACGCTATSSGPGPAFSSRSSWARPVSITAPISTTPTSTRWPLPRTPRWPRCCRESSSAPGRPIRMPRRCAAGVSIALATDCNPGTCYSSSMPWVISLAVREMGLSPAQALFAATAGSATSLRRTDIGRLVVGNQGRSRRAGCSVISASGLSPRRADRGRPRPRSGRPTTDPTFRNDFDALGRRRVRCTAFSRPDGSEIVIVVVRGACQDRGHGGHTIESLFCRHQPPASLWWPADSPGSLPRMPGRGSRTAAQGCRATSTAIATPRSPSTTRGAVARSTSSTGGRPVW